MINVAASPQSHYTISCRVLEFLFYRSVIKMRFLVGVVSAILILLVLFPFIR